MVSDEAIREHIARWEISMCPDPYCRVCRDEDGEVQLWLEEIWEQEGL